MNSELSQIIQNIYSSWSPLNNIEKRMISPINQGENFKKAVNEVLDDVDEVKKNRIMEELFGWGPLSRLRSRSDIFDIMVQGPHHIYFEDSSGLQKLDDCFLSDQSFRNFCERIQKDAGLLINQKDPFGNGRVGAFRVHMITPPIAKQTTLTFRRHREDLFTFDDMLKSGFFSDQQQLWLKHLIDTHQNFLVVGPTGSGKTTLLNTLLATLPSEQRLVIIEDTDEIISKNPLTTKLLSREVCPETLNVVRMEDLVKQSLRMRPDRLVVGEVRGAEAKDLLQALATGHTGSMGTLHAHSARQALLRLEMLIQMGAPQWSLHSIRQLIQMSLNYLVVLKEERGQKGIKEICRITSHESIGLLIEDVGKRLPE